MPGGETAVAGEDLGRGRQRPERVEVDSSRRQHRLDDVVEFVVRPFEGERPNAKASHEAEDRERRLRDAVRLPEQEQSGPFKRAGGDGECFDRQLVLAEVVARDRLLECLPSGHEPILAS